MIHSPPAGDRLRPAFDVDAGCTQLTAFDARNVSAGPGAMASLNGVAPLGLHGLFRAA